MKNNYIISHVFNKSISGYQIFKAPTNCQRFYNTLFYYNNKYVSVSFSNFLKKNVNFTVHSLYHETQSTLVRFISYCIMPDHYHLLLKADKEFNLSKYIGNVENSYTRYFNSRYKRIGPLWQTAYKYVNIKTNEQLLHVSRYIHLNPVTGYLTQKPEDWKFSSYHELINNQRLFETITDISIQNNRIYKQFVEDNADYQRKLKKIRRLMLDRTGR